MLFVFVLFFALCPAYLASNIQIKQEDGFFINDPKNYHGIKHPYVEVESSIKVRDLKDQSKIDSSKEKITENNLDLNSKKEDKNNTNNNDNDKRAVELKSEIMEESKSFDPFAKFNDNNDSFEKNKNQKTENLMESEKDFNQKKDSHSSASISINQQNDNDLILLDGLLEDHIASQNIKNLESETNSIQINTKIKRNRVNIEKILKKIGNAKNKSEEKRLTLALQNILNENKILENNSDSEADGNVLRIEKKDLIGNTNSKETQGSIFERNAFASETDSNIFERISEKIKFKDSNKSTSKKKDQSKDLKRSQHQNLPTKREKTESTIVESFTEDELIPERKVYNKNTKKQILPPNIAKAKKNLYLKENQHLDTIVFRETLMKNAFLAVDSDDNVRIIGEIISQTQNPNMQDQDGNTLLHHAVDKKKYSLIRFLIQSGLDPNIKNRNGFTALHLGSSYGDYNSVYYLLVGNANPNMKDQDGNTSFMYAAATGDIELTKLMVSFGVKLNEKNNLGKTAINIAYEKNNSSIVTYLASLEDKFIP